MRILTKISAVMFCGGLLAACGGTATTSPQGHGQKSILPGTAPAQAYALVARQIKACWFNPTSPVLTNHIFRAAAPAGGAATSQTNVVIYSKTPDGRRGLKTYSIKFEPRNKGTAVETQNHKLPYALAQKLTADVGYWIQGGANCDGPAPVASSPARGSYAPSSQRVSTPRRGSN